MNNRTRFPELDLLRFLAACSVMLFHYTFRAPLTHIWSVSFPTLSQISKYGYLGVDLFFILSGFVILLTAYEKNAFGFTTARIIRLYPAYWICLTITTIVVSLAWKPPRISLAQYLANLMMVQSYFGIHDISGVYWTLAVEVKFYFLVFLVLLLRQTARIAHLLGVWLVASLFLSLRPPHGVAWFFLFPEWSSYFIAGAIFFLIHREGINLYKLLLIAGCFLLSAGHALRIFPSTSAESSFGVTPSIVVTLLAVFYLGFLFIALRPRTRPAMSFSVLGLITYPLYLLHQDLGYVLLRWAPASGNRFVLLAAVMLIMVALSWLVHVGPERRLALTVKVLFGRLKRMALTTPKHAESDIHRSAPLPMVGGAEPVGALPAPVGNGFHGQARIESAQSSAPNRPLIRGIKSNPLGH